MLRVKPYKGRWCSRNLANEINDMLQSASKPDRTALKKEAKEVHELLAKRRGRKEERMPCNLSYAISEEAEKIGIEIGIEIGIKLRDDFILKKVEEGALSPENGAIAMDISVEEVLAKLEKAKRNADYFAMLDKSMAEAEAGRFITKNIAELVANGNQPEA